MLREFSNTGKSRCGSAGTAAAVSQPATRFFAAAFAPLVFCKEFHSNCARSSGTRGGNRGDAERSRGSRAAPSPWPRPGSPGMDLCAPGVRWLRCCRSHGWGAHPERDPHHRVSGTARPARLSCWWSHEVAPAPRPHGDSQPLGGANPPLPPCVCQECLSQASVPGNFASPAPPNSWGSAGGRRSGILPRRSPAQRSDLGNLLEFG